jgi:hypothetical protein
MVLGSAASEEAQHLDPEGNANSIFEPEPGKITVQDSMEVRT